ncbi:aminopeptidase [Eubacterium sp. An3]|uniref:aminopeptidase n=1 Tax=Eubacterium sp. An3 TaxID=1965628 RepID=UPI000B3970EE|nr:aminopeptidase [Eubacterium sp. An3]OUO29718.1 aminopeptidase [Eubacterium sp. An3]
MNIDTFLFLMLAVSVLTGLFTEAIKKVLDGAGKKYSTNLLTGAVSVVLAVAIAAGYVIMTDIILNDKMAVMLIALVLLSWLCAMVGYDKVMQAVTQVKTNKLK